MIPALRSPAALRPRHPLPPFFQVSLPDGAPVALRAFDRRRAPARTMIFRGTDRADHYFELLEGHVMETRMLDDGRRQVLGLLSPGDIFGISAEDVYGYDAETLSPVLVRWLSRDVVSPSRLAKQMVLKIESNRDHAFLLGKKTALERLASFLLDVAPRLTTGNSADHTPVTAMDGLFPWMTLMDIGDYLGVTHETACRNIAKLRKLGLIATDRQNRLRLLDREALRAIAKK